MLAKHLNTLELPKILEQLAKECSFSASIELAHALQPSTHPTEVNRKLDETSEARQALQTNDTLGIGGARDIRDMIMRAGRGGMMEPSELLDVRETLHSARNVQRAITRYADIYPRLNEIVELIEPQVELVENIAR